MSEEEREQEQEQECSSAMTNEAANDAAEMPKKRWASLYDWVEMAVTSLICVALVFAFVFRIVGVDGGSMIQTLHHTDRVLLWELFYTPSRGDIVVISRGEVEPLIKRVIGLPGDTITFDAQSQQVSVNGVVLDEPYVYIDGYAVGMVYSDMSVTVPDGTYFVMGDHRNNSLDSRDERIGLIDEKDILGKAILRMWPWESFTWL